MHVATHHIYGSLQDFWQFVRFKISWRFDTLHHRNWSSNIFLKDNTIVKLQSIRTSLFHRQLSAIIVHRYSFGLLVINYLFFLNRLSESLEKNRNDNSFGRGTLSHWFCTLLLKQNSSHFIAHRNGSNSYSRLTLLKWDIWSRNLSVPFVTVYYFIKL